MKTVCHMFYFDISKPAGSAAWADLKKKLEDWPHRMESLVLPGQGYHDPDRDGEEIELETTHLFDNQWNTLDGRRVFDWAVEAHYNGECKVPIRCGYYLDQTEEMREIRRNVVKCGYCGAQEPAAKRLVFCPHCIGSEYLNASDLHLTRMVPIFQSGFGPERKELEPLTAAEKAHLLPLYKEAQLRGRTARDKVRLARQRMDIEEKYQRDTANAKAEHDGLLWLLDHGVKIDNVIYYDHTGRFGFGWRHPVDAEILSELLDIITEFQWPYDIKCADGRTLSGER